MASSTEISRMSDKQLMDSAKKAVELKEKQHQALVRSGGVANFVASAKHSLLFQPSCNWNDMLSGAPVSISIMGSIFIASTTNLAQGIQLIPPTGGFKHISTYASDNGGKMALSSCLSQISALGDKAFSAARTGMSDIGQNSAHVITDVKTIFKLLSDPDSAKVMLKTTVQNLEKKAHHCADQARDIATNYHDWLSATCEVHAACCQASTDTSEKQRVNEVHLAAKQVEAKITSEAEAAAKDTMETLRISLQHADEQYQKAAKEYPSGWELIAQEAVSNLVSTATTALNQAIPAVIDLYTVQGNMKIVKQGLNIFEDGYGSIEGHNSADHSDVKPAKSATPPQGPVLPENYQDPAYSVIKTSAGWVDNLYQMLTSNNGSIDWNAAAGSDGKSGAGFLGLMLESDLKTLNKKPASTSPSTDLKNILIECNAVADAIDKWNSPTMNNQKPKDDSTDVKGWIATVHKHNTKAAAMNAIAATFPGPGAVPAATPPYQNVDGTGLRAQIISASANKLSTTSAVLTASQTNFKESSDNYSKTMAALSSIQGDIEKLRADKIQLAGTACSPRSYSLTGRKEQIKALLMKCIELLVQLQAQINKLVAFFDSIKLIVAIAVESQIDPFIAQISDVTAQPVQFGHYTITLFSAELVFNSMMNIRTYFSLFQDIADVYIEVHTKYLAEGLIIVGRMQTESQGLDADKLLKAKQYELAEYTNKALPGVKALLENRQAEVVKELESMAAQIASEIEFLPVAPLPEVKTGIDDAKNGAIVAAKAGLQETGSYYKKQIPAGTFPIEE